MLEAVIPSVSQTYVIKIVTKVAECDEKFVKKLVNSVVLFSIENRPWKRRYSFYFRKNLKIKNKNFGHKGFATLAKVCFFFSQESALLYLWNFNSGHISWNFQPSVNFFNLLETSLLVSWTNGAGFHFGNFVQALSDIASHIWRQFMTQKYSDLKEREIYIKK